MAARCASCSYPLSVSDSVSCCECLSYFHIDCAQLVGFPYYELSSDPVRNTFHCQTCKILPLPRQSSDYSDSDSDDCAMPSRQLECHLEGHPDLASEMNEIKGTVQDLSDLCKDLFREINELKSINLTLRCCVENLRQDGEQRNAIISDLQKRIEALEGKRTVNLFKPIDNSYMYKDGVNSERGEDQERFLTPDPEYCRSKESEILEQETFLNKETSLTNYSQNLISSNFESELSEAENINIENTKQEDQPQITIEIPDTETSDFGDEKIHENNEENVHFAEQETVPSTLGEECCINSSVKDWDWKGNKAIRLRKDKEYSYEEDEEENEQYETDIEDTEAQDWEILEEDVKSELAIKHCEKETTETTEGGEGPDEELVEKRVTWVDEVEKSEEDEESLNSHEDVEDPDLISDTTCSIEISNNKSASTPIFEGEGTEETTEDVTEEKTSLKGEEEEEDKSKLEDNKEILEGSEVEGRMDPAEGAPRLGGDSAVEDGAAPEGELEGGQSPEHRGEVQQSELPEGSEPTPPPPPQPQHTPDDLWDYLKETVSGEHPATVEEFVQKLIGTLEHVPEEYLKPVIDYNVKRATSPSVTDGEHLENKEGDQQLPMESQVTEETVSGEAQPEDNSEVAVEGDDTTTLPPQDSSITDGGFPSEEPAALHEDTGFPEDPSKTAEGYPALEATT